MAQAQSYSAQDGRAYTGRGLNSLPLEVGHETGGSPSDAYMGERELANAVFKQAFMDLGVRMDSQRGPIAPPDPEEGVPALTARAFLFGADHKAIRTFWLNWLGMTDEEFQRLLVRPTLQGQGNRLLKALGRGQ